MNFRQLEVFHAVYVSGSITAAAQVLHISQPAASKILRHAEDQLGFALFRRLRGKLQPTEEAQQLFNEAAEVYQRLGSLKRTAKNLRAGGAGRVRLAVLPSLGLSVAPAAIAQFRKQHPRTTFDVRTLDHEDIARCLYERESELAVGFVVPSHPRLRSLQIGAGELVLLHEQGDFSGGRGRVEVRRLAGRDFITLTGSGPLGILLAEELERLKVAVHEVVSTRTFYVAAALVRHALGVAVVDEFTARATETGGLTYSRLSPPISFGVYCIWLEDRPPSRVCQKFIATLTEALRDGSA